MSSSGVAAAWLEDAFQSARDEFLKNVKSPQNHEVFKFSSIDDVYQATDEIQKRQAKTKTLRCLQSIEPLLLALKEFSGTVEVFIQAKPDILALIWGPLKLILQLADSLSTMFGKVVQVLSDIGGTLPTFQKYAPLLEQNQEAKRVLCLFYRDILECYTILLDHTRDRRRRDLLEVVWPKTRSKLDVVQKNIEYHKGLMTDQVTLEAILQSFDARKKAMQEHEEAQAARDDQQYRAKLAEISPPMYDRRLREIRQDSSPGSGEWLAHDHRFTTWADPKNSASRCLWLCGIPGSGKTFLAANAIGRVASAFGQVLYVFLSYDNQDRGQAIDVYHSLLFQAARGSRELQSYLLAGTADLKSTKFSIDFDYIKKLMSDVLSLSSSTAIIIDGLDEMKEDRRRRLIQATLETLQDCPGLKILFSSRDERDIRARLESEAVVIRIDQNNQNDIQSYAEQECESWVADLESRSADEAMLAAAQESVAKVVAKSHGMFLYAKLVLLTLKDQGTAADIREELGNLPDGLDQAYGRILDRIQTKISSKLRADARTTLQWMVCSQIPLREEEIQQILVIEPGTEDFTKGPKSFQDIQQACGPIIEVVGGVVRFVHFSAKEYIESQEVGFVDRTRAEFDAAAVCATYLLYKSLDPLFQTIPIEPSDLDAHLHKGDYVFLEYASNMLLHHLSNIKTSEHDAMADLNGILESFLEARYVGSDEEVSRAKLDHFEAFKTNHELQRLLTVAFVAHEKDRNGLFDEDEEDSQRDPLQLKRALCCFRERLEALLCEDDKHADTCSCTKLAVTYGRTPYYCSAVFCRHYHLGFSTRQSRDEHQAKHKRPYKCRYQECEFFDAGFRSFASLAKHQSSCHSENRLSNSARVTSSEDSPLWQSALLLEDSIICSDFDTMQALISQQPELLSFSRAPEPHSPLDELARQGGFNYALCLASWKSTTEALDCLHSLALMKGLSPNLHICLRAAIEGKNKPNIKFWLNRGASMEQEAGYPPFFWALISQDTRLGKGGMNYVTNLSVALSLWDLDLMDYLTQECQVIIPDTRGKHHTPFRLPAIRDLSDQDVSHQFEAIRKYVKWPDLLSRIVVDACVSMSLRSLELCLRNGGDVNAQSAGRGRRSVFERCFHFARVIDMEMARLLLQYGATPRMDTSRRDPLYYHRRKMKFEAAFGMPWDEFIRRSQAGEELRASRNRVQKPE